MVAVAKWSKAPGRGPGYREFESRRLPQQRSKMAEFDIICKQCGAKGRIVGVEKAHVFENLIRNRKGSEILFTYGLNEDEEESLMIRCIKCGALLEDTI